MTGTIDRVRSKLRKLAEAADASRGPWRFVALDGSSVVVHPGARLVVIGTENAVVLGEDGVPRPGRATIVHFTLPGDATPGLFNAAVREAPEEVERQVRARGGW